MAVRTIVDPPSDLGGLIGDVFSWVKGKGNRPGTPESRAGIVSREDVERELARIRGDSPPAPVASIGGVPMDQVIMLSGVALAALLLLRSPAPAKRR